MFASYLANRHDFTSSTSASWTRLKYTDVAQNMNTDVFQVDPFGVLTVRMPGVVSCMASFDVVVASAATFARGRIVVNDVERARASAPRQDQHFTQ